MILLPPPFSWTLSLVHRQFKNHHFDSPFPQILSPSFPHKGDFLKNSLSSPEIKLSSCLWKDKTCKWHLPVPTLICISGTLTSHCHYKKLWCTKERVIFRCPKLGLNLKLRIWLQISGDLQIQYLKFGTGILYIMYYEISNLFPWKA